jgi:hypothetical protein
MSEILELQHKLLDTSATISQLERALLAEPESPVLRLNLDSVVNRFNHLESEFHVLADRQALDVCTYRLFASAELPNLERDRTPSLRGISTALLDFQLAFSAMFDALKNGRRLRSRMTPDVLQATSFVFGYAFPGSVGVVLMLEHERLLLDGDMLDDAIMTFFSLAQAPTDEDIRAIGHKLGPAPLHAIFKWAQAHVEDSLGADISWRRGTTVAASLFLQLQELERLSSAIAATSEDERETIDWAGRLTGADVKTRRFRFEPDGGEAVHGSFVDAINEAHVVTLPSRYLAHLEKSTRIHYSSEEEQVTWKLLSLDKIYLKAKMS